MEECLLPRLQILCCIRVSGRYRIRLPHSRHRQGNAIPEQWSTIIRLQADSRRRARTVLGGLTAAALLLTLTVGVAAPSLADPAHPAPTATITPQSSFSAASASASAISGLYPADIANAYGLTGGVSGTVGIVAAYGDSHLESDLAVYRAQFDLPACSVASGCLTIVDQDGGSALPRDDDDWAGEQSLDVQAVSAACPACRLLVVQAGSTDLDDAATAVSTAVQLGADAVSNSYGALEDGNVDYWSDLFDQSASGVPVLAAAGDGDDSRAIYPAALPNVIAVGGTTLTPLDPATPHVRGAEMSRASTSSTATGGDGPSARVGSVTPLLRTAGTATVKTLTAQLASARNAQRTLTKQVAAAKRAVKKATGLRCRTVTHPSAAQKRALAKCRQTHARAVSTAKRKLTALQHRLKTAAAHTAAVTAALHRAQARAKAGLPVTATPVATPKPTTSAPAPVASVPVASAPVAPTPVASTPTVAPRPVASSAPTFAGWAESAWSGGQAGCSASVPKPTWQVGVDTQCGDDRALADVSAVADPQTGLAVYDTLDTDGWILAGGTSLSTPLVTAMLVRSGRARADASPASLYANASAFRDITAGSVARCWVAANCDARAGYDLGTGLGVPSSLSSF